MRCAYCERMATYRVQAGLNRLHLCPECAQGWARRTLGKPVIHWLRQLKPIPKAHSSCPFCGTTPQQVRESGLYGCALCYTFIGQQV